MPLTVVSPKKTSKPDKPVTWASRWTTFNSTYLDGRLQPVPLGVAGEIYIGGAGVARGYLNRPGLTAERFIANPHGRGRLYKTGDLGRWLPDGSVEYLGRNDFQVKIRGFRVELGEVEAQLAKCPGVREAAVVAREDAPGDKRLVAYLVAEAGHEPTAAELRAQLSAVLAEYMVPGAYVDPGVLPAHPERQARPQGAAGAGRLVRRQPRLRGAAGVDRSPSSPNLARAPAP